MIKPSVNLQELRRRIYCKAKAEKPAGAVAGRDGVTRRSIRSGGWLTNTESSASIDRLRKCLPPTRQIAPYEEQTQESVVREIRMLRLTWRGLETGYGEASEAPSDERDGNR